MNWKLKLLVMQDGRPQWEIAQELGWSESKLSRVIHERIPLGIEGTQQLAAVLHISQEDIYGD